MESHSEVTFMVYHNICTISFNVAVKCYNYTVSIFYALNMSMGHWWYSAARMPQFSVLFFLRIKVQNFIYFPRFS